MRLSSVSLLFLSLVYFFFFSFNNYRGKKGWVDARYYMRQAGDCDASVPPIAINDRVIGWTRVSHEIRVCLRDPIRWGSAARTVFQKTMRATVKVKISERHGSHSVIR